MHENIGRKGTRRFFWNQLTGELALFPLLFPLAIARITHLQHHRFTNDPLRDPDQPDLAPSFWRAVMKVWLNRQPNPSAQIHHVRRVIYEQIGTAEAATAFKAAMLLQLAALTFWFAMAWAGHAAEVALLWWLPRWLALIQIRVGFSWEPHHPHDAQGRYRATRVFRSRFGPGLLSMGIEGHLAHHLYPTVPMHLTPAMLRELAPLLAERGVDCGALRGEGV
jgi:beta-carotene hydroxylase